MCVREFAAACMFCMLKMQLFVISDFIADVFVHNERGEKKMRAQKLCGKRENGRAMHGQAKRAEKICREKRPVS